MPPAMSKKRSASRPPEGRPKKVRPNSMPFNLSRTLERKRKYYGLAPLTARSDSIYLYNPLYYLVMGALS